MQLDLKTVKKIITLPKVTIDLGDDKHGLYKDLNKRHPRYKIIRNKTLGVCLIKMSDFTTHDDYLKSINGKNSAAYYARKAKKRGHTFCKIDRNKYINDIFDINTSKEIRQGIPMTTEFQKKVLHYQDKEDELYYGVLDKNGILRSYCWFWKAHEVIIVDTLLGHKNFLNDGVMYLLLTGALQNIRQTKDVKYVMYDMFFGAAPGLKMFKSKLGFRPYRVSWTRQVKHA